MIRRVLSAAVLVGAMMLATIGPVQSLNQSDLQPYGGCKEAWQAPRSEGADWCRDQGWTVRKRVVLNPHGVVRAWNLPKCDGETVPCGHLAGRGPGVSYFLTGTWDKHRVTYLWSPSPLMGHPHRQWVRSGMADALAEGSSDGASTRRWGRCWTNGNGVTCPDGFSETWE